MESKVETNNDTVEIKNEVDNDTTQPEVVKKKRGRPRKHPQPEPKPQTTEGDEPKEPKKRGRPVGWRSTKVKPVKEPKKKGRRRIYEEGTIGKPKDPDYFKNYYKNITYAKRQAKRLEKKLQEQNINN